MEKITKLTTHPTPVAIQHSRSPFLTPFLSLHDELDRAITNFYQLSGFRHFIPQSFENLTLKPAMDIVDDKDYFKVEAEMPGMSEKEINVSIGDGMLIIKGEKELSKKDTGKNYIAREIGYGRHERAIALPQTADVSKAKASFKKGMLSVEIPKKSESTQRSHDLKIEKAA